MDVPLEIAFHNLDKSDSLEERVREHVAKLERIYPRLVSCRVVIEAPHRQHQKGNLPRVRIDMSVPGDEIVVSREPRRVQERYADIDLYALVRDAFDTAERRLKQFKEKQYGEVKVHDTPMHGHVTHVDPGKDYGMLRTPRGVELYFHRNALMNEELEKLAAGDAVHYVETMGETGPQASRVWKVLSEHQQRGTGSPTGLIE